MQAELENWAIDWINEHCDLALSNPNPVRYLRDQFAELLKGKVLCDADDLARYKALAGELAVAIDKVIDGGNK